MSLFFSDGGQFSQGSCPYEHRPVTDREMSPRIMIQIAIADIQTYAMVDTGGVYLLCPPQFADLIDLRDCEPLEEAVTMLVPRYGRLKGDLHRVPLKLLAVEGSGLEVSATAFVPRTPDGQSLPFPPIMGLQGCLERLRFAVDPYDDTFYFGTIGEEDSV